MASSTETFDFRLAVRERERAIRLLEATLNRCAQSGEDIDREVLERLLVLVNGSEPSTTVSLR